MHFSTPSRTFGHSIINSLLQFYLYHCVMKTGLLLTALLTLTAVILQLHLSPPASQQGNYGREVRRLKINYPFYEEYLSTNTRPSFKEWSRLHGKVYSSEEERLYRAQVYSENIREIAQHNLLYEAGRSSFFKGMNKYGDLTPQEFAEKFNWRQEGRRAGREGGPVTKECTGAIMDTPNPPAELNWGKKVSEVRDQGSCGKDWAMVAAEAVESLYALKIGELPALSTQQLVECSVGYGNEGCSGGFMDQAFEYIVDEGIALASSYLERNPPQKCEYKLIMKFTTITRCARVPSRSYSKLLSAIVQQPVSIALDQNPDMFFYKGGIYDGKCTSALNHGMLLVGYGGKTLDEYYWRLKNTLGTTWGSAGYINLKRTESDGDGKCGLQLWPSVPQGIV